MNLSTLTASQLRKAATLKEKIDDLNAELGALLGAGDTQSASSSIRRRTVSPAAIARMRAAAKARWAKVKRQGSNGRPRRKMTAAGRARLAALAKARWKKAKAEGRMAL